MKEPSRYEQRGVSATKDEVHAAIKDLDKGLYPLAFCKVLPDIVGGDPAYCNIMHADTAGTKTSLAYLYHRQTGNEAIWRGISQDAIVMNVDDMACVGCVDNIVLSSTIGRNKHLISGKVISEVIQGTVEFCERMASHGIHIHLAGGETADVGDIVRTIDVGFTTFARLPRAQLIVNRIEAGDVIVGLASDGQASYESAYNAGIGSNGLTAARHDVLGKYYATAYPDSYDPNMDESVLFTGKHGLKDDFIVDGQRMDLGQALLSPTRTYLPVLHEIYARHRSHIHGVIHCTGGGQGKVLKFVKDKHVIKDRMMPTPPLFELIQASSGTSWREMYQVFNMGHRMELYVPPDLADDIIAIAGAYQIKSQIIGHVEEHAGEKVTIVSPYGNFTYVPSP